MVGRAWRTATGCGALTVLLAVGLGGCTDDPAAKPRPSALSGASRTCTDTHARCTESGALRWSLPLRDRYRADADYGDSLVLRAVVLDEKGHPVRLLADRDTVYVAAGSQLLAIDAATGRPRWSHRATGSAADTTGDMRMLAGRLLVPQDVLGGEVRYLSVDPHTGADVVLPFRPGEEDLGAWAADEKELPPRDLVLASGGIWSDEERATVRGVDPATGRTRWQVSVGRYWQRTVRGGVLYLDDYRERADLPENVKNRLQTRAVQRVDLRSGRRLPDVELPRSLWGRHHIGYVTSDETIVLEDAPADGGATYAVDLRGRRLDAVPEDDRDQPADDERTESFEAKGPGDGLRRLVAYDGPGEKRWTGPALMAPGTTLLTDTTPRLAVATGCAPDAVRKSSLTDPMPGVLCTEPRVFAVTW